MTNTRGRFGDAPPITGSALDQVLAAPPDF